MNKIEIIGIKLPLIKPGDDIVDAIIRCVNEQEVQLLDGDVLVITEKIVSKSMGLLIEEEKVKPSKEALRIANKTGLNPRFVELILRESDDVVAVVPIRELVYSKALDLFSLAEDVNAAKKTYR
ncbi:coenzyme F420-0:L-glutamate ligase [Thermogladius sp. 4427co]|uniref:coenzyme F420-0:L-glutamate ligase n=1 Tax=Thermogladius sp. 4427co TaxID=3450718 RepID=UPI003F7A6AD9